MAFLSELNSIQTIATNMLITNPRVCKLLTYYPSTVDFRYDPLSKPPVENPSSLLLERIYPMPKQPDAETEQVCMVDVNIASGDLTKTNKGFAHVYLIFDVICHLDSWVIKSGFRPLSVVSEIDGMFNNQKTDLPIMNKPVFVSLRAKGYSHRFYGYEITYDLMVNSNLEC